MQRRCPGAALLGTATLHDHSLVFAGFSPGWGGAVASVIPRRGELVQGVLYLLTPDDLRRLDVFEGCPVVYQRNRRWVVDPGGELRTAVVYMKVGDFALGPPSDRYIDVIRNAYDVHGFSATRLRRAVRRSRASTAKSR